MGELANKTFARLATQTHEPRLTYRGCNIQRSGSSGIYTYSVAGDWADRPVNWVDWGDAARFANWLHNGQPTGAQDLTTTEDGAYYLNGATSDPALLAVTRDEEDWKWAIPIKRARSECGSVAATPSTKSVAPLLRRAVANVAPFMTW